MNYVYTEVHTYRFEADSMNAAKKLLLLITSKKTDEIDRDIVCEETAEEEIL